MTARDEGSRARPAWWLLLVVLVVAAAIEWSLGEPRSHQQQEPLAQDDAAAPARLPSHANDEPSTGRKPSAAGSPCRPRARQACYEGNVWWLDSCDRALELALSCQGLGCEGERCKPDPRGVNHCGPVSAYGACDGDIAKACVGGEILSIDCERSDERCVTTSEGALCLPRDELHGCSAHDLPSCIGDRLHLCIDGLWRELDCAARHASCSAMGSRAHCAALGKATSPAAPLELCDKRDNDRDGRVDEGGVCEPVALVAFVPSSAPADLAARMSDELEKLNRILAPMVFQWSRVVQVDDSYREFPPDKIGAAARHFAQSQSVAYLASVQADDTKHATPDSTDSPATAGLSFYVPVLYVDHLLMQPPKAAISTLPNQRCGSVRISDAPTAPGGLIVLSESRQPETLAHEMGHYLGLCHTHEDLSRVAVSTRSEDPCTFTGDGVCDTPLDPGPERCMLQNECIATCTVLGADPSTANVMSYYIGCRTELTQEQLAEAERNLSLRRGWFRCLSPEDCPCQPGVAHACPPEMSCQPGSKQAGSWSCGLDGASLPGAACRNGNQCAESSFCLQTNDKNASASRCVRPCQDADDICTCVDIGLPFRVCAEDLGKADLHNARGFRVP